MSFHGHNHNPLAHFSGLAAEAKARQIKAQLRRTRPPGPKRPGLLRRIVRWIRRDSTAGAV